MSMIMMNKINNFYKKGGKKLLYENVKDIAAKKGLSITKLEEEAKLSKGTISKWKMVSPKVDNVQAVAKVLRVSVNTLLKE